MSRVLPILFNTDMVRSILDGRKTVTRRCVKFINGKNPNWTGYIKDGLMLYNGTNEPCIRTCQYQPGDILYVRETWHKYKKRVRKGEGCHIAEFYGYKASIANSEDANEPWKPSIHMPKEAARIWLKVKDVRVEWLQAITKEQARAEGCDGRCECPSSGAEGSLSCVTRDFSIEKFETVWDSTIKKSDLDRYGWDTNPYVFVIEFERCEKPDSI